MWLACTNQSSKTEPVLLGDCELVELFPLPVG
jgi:hypothetical protein